MNDRNGGEVKEPVISFRLRSEDYELIEEIARLDGETPNAWARKRLLDEARQGAGLSRKERLMLEQLARLGYLIEHGFGIQLAADKTTDAEWVRRVQASKSAAARLVEMALERGSTGAGNGAPSGPVPADSARSFERTGSRF
jgi:hypothetical protein